MTPRVSVILPAFNGAAFIADALQCVHAQGLDELELIVVDDGSTDSTADVLARSGFDLRYERQTRGGPAAARNRGLALAQGSLIAFIDQDDLWPADHLSTLMQILDTTPSAAVAMGLTQALLLTERSSNGTAFAPYGSPWRAPHVGCALFRREVFDAVGPLDATLRYCSDDLDWFMRAREQGAHIVETDAVTLLFRIHETNASSDRALRRNALIEAIHASVRRRRVGSDG